MDRGRADYIDAAQVNRELAHTRFAGNIMHFREVDSTQRLALEAARAGARCGAWVADAQTAGRGRGGHTWHSAPGDGLYVTALFTPQVPANSKRVSLLAGLAAWSAIRDVSGVSADIRWPNDLVTRPGVYPRARKVGGVLAESALSAAAEQGGTPMLRYVAIGIGLNVGHASFPQELAEVATSLHMEGWQQPRRQPLLVALLRKLEFAIHGTEASGTATAHGPDSLPDVRDVSTWLVGKHVHVAESGGYTGVTDGLDDDGFLQVRVNGELRTVRSGGVREA